MRGRCCLGLLALTWISLRAWGETTVLGASVPASANGQQATGQVGTGSSPASERLAQVEERLASLDAERQSWLEASQAQATSSASHQQAMESFAAQRLELLVQRSELLGDSARAARIRQAALGAPKAQPLNLERVPNAPTATRQLTPIEGAGQ